MEALSARATHTVLSPLPGRSFAFSPRWQSDGASVLFDCNSGDYWVVALATRAIVECVTQIGPHTTDDLYRHLLDVADVGEFDDSLENIGSLVAELVQQGILAQTERDSDLDPTRQTGLAID